MSAFRAYTSSLVPYQDLKTEGLRLMIVESIHIRNCSWGATQKRTTLSFVVRLYSIHFERNPAYCLLPDIFMKA